MTLDGSVRPNRPMWFRIVRVLLIGASSVIGVGLVLLAFTVGDCSAFGGRCPSEPPALIDDDTFRIAGLGAALVVAPSVFLSRPSWQRLAVAAASAAAAFVVVGVMARSATTG